MNPDRGLRRRRRPKRGKRPAGEWEAERRRRDAMVTARYGQSAHYSCGRKARYETQAEAMGRAAVGVAHGQPFLRAYQCPYCGGWHLSSHSYGQDHG